MILADIETFSQVLIKCLKLGFNPNIVTKYQKQHMCKITINNGWDTQVVHILHEECDENFHFKRKPAK